MSTKTTTTQTPSFAPSGMQAYNALQPGIQSTLGYYMGGMGGGKQGIFGSPFFQAALGQGTKQAGQLGAGNIANIGQMASAGGWGGTMQPFQMGLMQSAGMQNSALRQQAFWNALNQATGLQMQATGLATGYRPLETGMTTTQAKTGLGTWLPQVASLALGAGLAPFTGGLSLAGALGGFAGTEAGSMGQGDSPMGYGSPNLMDSMAYDNSIAGIPYGSGGIPGYGVSPLLGTFPGFGA